MHAKKSTFPYMPVRAAIGISLVLTGVLLVIGAVISLAGNHSTSANAVPVVQTMSQPPTAAQIASEEHCTNFQDKKDTTGGDPTVLDDGICYVGSVKYGVNTFASPSSRDSWLKLAALVGVVPKWETATSVTYKSVSS